LPILALAILTDQACGAAAGISATFNAPTTGVLFGVELILRELAIDSLLPTVVSAVVADVIGRAFFDSAPIFSQMPHNPGDHPSRHVPAGRHPRPSRGTHRHRFSRCLYKVEDLCDSSGKTGPSGLGPPSAAPCSGWYC
jgi:chloride channel protein, CIC family